MNQQIEWTMNKRNERNKWNELTDKMNEQTEWMNRQNEWTRKINGRIDKMSGQIRQTEWMNRRDEQMDRRKQAIWKKKQAEWAGRQDDKQEKWVVQKTKRNAFLNRKCGFKYFFCRPSYFCAVFVEFGKHVWIFISKCIMIGFERWMICHDLAMKRTEGRKIFILNVATFWSMFWITVNLFFAWKTAAMNGFHVWLCFVIEFWFMNRSMNVIIKQSMFLKFLFSWFSRFVFRKKKAFKTQKTYS